MKMHELFAAILCVVGMIVSSDAAVGGTIFSLPNSNSSSPDELRLVDTADGSTTSTVTMTSGDGSILGGNGLAVDPTSNMMYAVLQIGSLTAAQTLVTVNPATGATTTIGSVDPGMTGIAFSASGTLYGVIDSPQETLVTLSTGDATSSFFMVLGNGGDGETIAYNSDDGLMYHASGQNIAGNILLSKIFEPIDLSVPSVGASITIPDYVQGVHPEEVTALTYAGGGDFYMADRISGNPAGSASGFFTIDTAGGTSYVGAMDHYSNGLAVYIPEPATAWLAVVGLAIGAFVRKRK